MLPSCFSPADRRSLALSRRDAWSWPPLYPIFRMLFWQCAHWAELNTNNTTGRRGGGAGEETEERDARCVMVARGDKLPLWHLNKCQGQGVRRVETMRDWIRAMRRCCFVTGSTDARQPIRLQHTCLAGLCLDTRSPFRRWWDMYGRVVAGEILFCFSSPPLVFQTLKTYYFLFKVTQPFSSHSFSPSFHTSPLCSPPSPSLGAEQDHPFHS